jgi:hypothetical protein
VGLFPRDKNINKEKIIGREYTERVKINIPKVWGEQSLMPEYNNILYIIIIYNSPKKKKKRS